MEPGMLLNLKKINQYLEHREHDTDSTRDIQVLKRTYRDVKAGPAQQDKLNRKLMT